MPFGQRRATVVTQQSSGCHCLGMTRLSKHHQLFWSTDSEEQSSAWPQPCFATLQWDKYTSCKLAPNVALRWVSKIEADSWSWLFRCHKAADFKQLMLYSWSNLTTTSGITGTWFYAFRHLWWVLKAQGIINDCPFSFGRAVTVNKCYLQLGHPLKELNH